MSYTVIFEMNPQDVARLDELRQDVLNVEFAGNKVLGRIAIDKYINGFFEAKIWPAHEAKDSLINVRLDGIQTIIHNIQDDPVTRTEVYYGISGDSFVSTQYGRERYRKLANLRKRQESLTRCVTPEAYFDDWDCEYVMCGHDPSEHTKDGCQKIVWYDDGGSRCGCEHYTKPAPLACLST